MQQQCNIHATAVQHLCHSHTSAIYFISSKQKHYQLRLQFLKTNTTSMIPLRCCFTVVTAMVIRKDILEKKQKGEKC